MIRKIIRIDEEKCSGCGLCADACHEGAIEMVDGKAKLVRENFCDGFGDCLPNCPAGAISFEEREAPAYDEAAVKAAQKKKAAEKLLREMRAKGGCPGSRTMELEMQSPHHVLDGERAVVLHEHVLHAVLEVALRVVRLREPAARVGVDVGRDDLQARYVACFECRCHCGE